MEPARPEVTVEAPAKINLNLRVRGRRADGYHELESLFLPLDLRDEVCVAVRRAGAVSVALSISEEGAGRPGDVPADASNLAHAAAAAFLAAAGVTARLSIDLRKRIPAAAGLGGGSSDAGAVLRALDTLYPGALPTPELSRVALELGADVPFFLDPRPAFVSGIGERIEASHGVPALFLLLCHPGEPLSTREVFGAWDALHPDRAAPDALTPSSGPSTMRAPETGDGGAIRLSDLLSGLVGELANDLEPAAVRLCPGIARLRARIEAAGALLVGMSGSGPTMFGVFSGPQEARKALAAVRESGNPGGGTSARQNSESRLWARVATTIQSP